MANNSFALPRLASLAFSAGVVGALVSAAIYFVAVRSGLLALSRCRLNPAFGAAVWWDHWVVFGGLSGLLVLLPILRKRPRWRGLVIGLVPALFTLLLFYPQRNEQIGGVAFGYTTPLWILLIYFIWGATTVAWYRATASGR